MPQGQQNPGFRSVRVKMRFSQKGLKRFQKKISIWLPVNTQQDWSAKSESADSLIVHYHRNTVCHIYF